MRRQTRWKCLINFHESTEKERKTRVIMRRALIFSRACGVLSSKDKQKHWHGVHRQIDNCHVGKYNPLCGRTLIVVFCEQLNLQCSSSSLARSFVRRRRNHWFLILSTELELHAARPQNVMQHVAMIKRHQIFIVVSLDAAPFVFSDMHIHILCLEISPCRNL